MLRELDIRDMLIIDRLELAFQPGLNVLTGETGAGKSILLDALGFVLGWRGRADLVRAGAAQGEVSALFDLAPGHAARGVLADAGLPDGDELILRRVNYADGRKAAWVNDRRTSAEVLRALSDVLVERHGQHDDRGLLDPKGHRALLDVFAGADTGSVRGAWRALAAAQRELATAETALAAVASEEDYLRHAAGELDRFAPVPGEEEALDARRRAMQGAARIRADVVRAAAALGTDGAESALADALRWLEGAAPQAEDRLDAAIAAAGRALTELGEAQDAVSDYLGDMTFDPAELEAVEERLFALRGLGRKHGVPADELAAFAEGLRGRLAALDGGAAGIAALERSAREAGAAYDEAAGALSALRFEAARRLDEAMAAELGPLKMERAVFATEIAPAEPGPDGRDAVTFSVATNPGAPAGPLNRIASGGELSRFLLALKVCLVKGADGLTLVFDEIDRGVGGATADAVGRRLKSLAEMAQVLVVTHSPQVAALGAHHWRVEKRMAAASTTSTVTPLGAADRVDEIARMLSGDRVTEPARAAARMLLEG